MDIAIPAERSGLTAEWLSDALRAGGVFADEAVAAVRVEDLGTGHGMTGEVMRLNVTWDGDQTNLPAQMIAKLPTAEPQNLHVAHSLGLYAREVGFYQHLAANTPIRTPDIYFADIEPASQDFVLLMEDLSGGRPGDQVAGASADDASTAIAAIAQLHARWWDAVDTPDTAALFDFANPQFVTAVQELFQAYAGSTQEKFPELISRRQRQILEAYAPCVATHVRDMASGRRTLVHGDFRADNLLFGLPTGEALGVVDWQVCGRSSGLYDVACFMAGSVTSELRRDIERDVLVRYHQTLLDGGVEDFSFDACWDAYRQATLAILIGAVYAAGGFEVGNERGKALAAAGLSRSLTAIEDLDADAFIG